MFANRNVIMWLIIDISIILHGNVIPYVLFGYVYWRFDMHFNYLVRIKVV